MALAFVVLVVLVVLAVVAFVALARWPGGVAKERSHPQADAINVLSWGGLLLTGGIGWLVALTWAYAKSPLSRGGDGGDLHARIEELETKLAALEAAQAQA